MLITWSLLVWVWVGLKFFCNIWLESSGYFRSFLSYQAVPFLPLWLERAGFCWGCVCGVSRLLISLPPSLGHLRQKENPGNSPSSCYSLDPEVPSLSAFFSPSSSLDVCFIYNVQLYLAGGIGKSKSIPSSQEQKALRWIWLTFYCKLLNLLQLTINITCIL